MSDPSGEWRDGDELAEEARQHYEDGRLAEAEHYDATAAYPLAEFMGDVKGARILVLNALQLLPHYSHFTLSEALEVVGRLRPERAFFVHMAHHLGRHAEVCAALPPSVTLAYDGLAIS